MNAWRTPQRVVAADCPDQIADVGRDRRPADTTARFPTPVQTEAAPMPAHQRLRLEDNRGFPSSRPVTFLWMTYNSLRIGSFMENPCVERVYNAQRKIYQAQGLLAQIRQAQWREPFLGLPMIQVPLVLRRASVLAGPINPSAVICEPIDFAGCSARRARPKTPLR